MIICDKYIKYKGSERCQILTPCIEKTEWNHFKTKLLFWKNYYNIFEVDFNHKDRFIAMINNDNAFLLEGIGFYYKYHVHSSIKWYDIKKLRKEKLKQLNNIKK